MSFAPKSDLTLDSLFYREIPNEIFGKVTSLDKLKEFFPEIKIVKEEILEFQGEKQGYLIYGIEKEKQINQYVAYQCLSCETIVAGPPIKKHYDTTKTSPPLSGGIGSDEYCHNCNEHLKHNVSLIR